MTTLVGFEWQLWYEKAGVSQFGQKGINVTFGDSEVTEGSGTQPPLPHRVGALSVLWGTPTQTS